MHSTFKLKPIRLLRVHSKKRVVAAALSAVMLISMLPMQSLAAPVGRDGTGARSYTDSAGNVYLGGTYMELGLSKTGSFGTSKAAPQKASPAPGGVYFHPDRRDVHKISYAGLGLRSDGDGWEQGMEPTTKDFFLPGAIDEGFLIGWGSPSTLKSMGSQINTNSGNSAYTNYSTTDLSTDSLLKAQSTGTAANTLLCDQTVSFGKDDKIFKVSVTLTNTTASAISNASYTRRFDPDQKGTDVGTEEGYLTDNYFYKDSDGGIWVIASTDKLDSANLNELSGIDHKTALAAVKNPFIFYTDDSRAQAVYGDLNFSDVTTAYKGEKIYGKHIYADKSIGLEFTFPTIEAGESVTFSYYSSLDPDFVTAEETINSLNVNITKQPVSKTFIQGSITGKLKVEGELLINGVSADDSSLKYQWYKNDSNSNSGGTPISGATNSSFTIPTDLELGSSYYYCVASAMVSGVSDSAASAVAEVQVVAAGTSIYKVAFDANAGLDAVTNMPSQQTIADGRQAVSTGAPLRSGYTFDGWYTEAAGTTKWDFSNSVEQDVTLYAKWTEPDTTQPIISNLTGNPTTWVDSEATISFTASDNEEIFGVTVKKDSESAKTLIENDGRYSFTTTGNGTYVITVTDTAGNTATQTVPVTKVDTVTPVINVTHTPADLSGVTESDVIFTLSNSAANVSGTAYWVSKNGETYTELSGNTFVVNVSDNSTYTFKAISGANKESTPSDSYTVNVIKPDYTPIVVTGAVSGWTNTDVTLKLSGGLDAGTFARYEYSSDNMVTWKSVTGTSLTLSTDQDKTYVFRVVSLSNSTGSMTGGTAVKIDKTLPAGSITVEKSSWRSFLQTITFNLFFKENIGITVKSEEDLSGIAKTEIHLSEKSLSQEQIEILTDWAAYNDTHYVTASDARNYVVYVRFTDNAGNISYISSDGFTFDTSKPAISGVQDKGIYYVDQIVTVTDTNLKDITLNDAPFVSGSKLPGNVNADYELIATDKAGNSTTYTLTAKTIASLSDSIVDLSADNVKTTDTAAVKRVQDMAAQEMNTTGNGAAEEQIAALQKVIDDAKELQDRITSVVDKINNSKDMVADITIENVKKEDQKNLENAIQDLEGFLKEYDGNLIKEEEKVIQDKIDSVEKVVDVLDGVKNVEDKIDALPDNVTKGDADAVSDANNAYQELTNHQKDIISPIAIEKLEKVITVLKNLLLVDSSTGTKIEGVDGTEFDVKTELIVTPVKDTLNAQTQNLFEQGIEKVSSGQQIVQLYDIKMMLNGKHIQPDGKVKITLTLTEDQKNYEDLKVVYIADDGVVTILPYEREDDSIIFITDHFSYYGIIGTPVNTSDKTPVKTPDTVDRQLSVPLLMIAILSMGVIYLMSPKKRKVKKY